MIPPPMTPQRQALLAEIAEFNAAYAACIDDDRLEQWPEFFVADCLYRVLPRENVDLGLPAPIMYCDNQGMLVDRVVALRKANIYPAHYSRHLLGAPVLLSADPDRPRVQAAYAVLHTRMDGKTTIYSAGKYLDEFVRVEGGLRLRQRDVIFDTNRIETSMATPL